MAHVARGTHMARKWSTCGTLMAHMARILHIFFTHSVITRVRFQKIGGTHWLPLRPAMARGGTLSPKKWGVHFQKIGGTHWLLPWRP